MKKIIVTGNVGRDPETRYAPNGESFVAFSLAVSVGTKDNPRTDWLDVTCNGRLAETVQKWVRKGSKLLIEGTPVASAYMSKEGKPVATLRVYANTMEFIGSKERSEEAGAPNESYDNAPFEAPSAVEPKPSVFNAPGPSLQSDDIPF